MEMLQDTSKIMEVSRDRLGAVHHGRSAAVCVGRSRSHCRLDVTDAVAAAFVFGSRALANLGLVRCGIRNTAGGTGVQHGVRHVLGGE